MAKGAAKTGTVCPASAAVESASWSGLIKRFCRRTRAMTDGFVLDGTERAKE